jgi:hypothetical protein
MDDDELMTLVKHDEEMRCYAYDLEHRLRELTAITIASGGGWGAAADEFAEALQAVAALRAFPAINPH